MWQKNEILHFVQNDKHLKIRVLDIGAQSVPYKNAGCTLRTNPCRPWHPEALWHGIYVYLAALRVWYIRTRRYPLAHLKPDVLNGSRI